MKILMHRLKQKKVIREKIWLVPLLAPALVLRIPSFSLSSSFLVQLHRSPSVDILFRKNQTPSTYHSRHKRHCSEEKYCPFLFLVTD